MAQSDLAPVWARIAKCWLCPECAGRVPQRAGAVAVKPKHVTRVELVDALERVALDADQRSYCDYDTLSCLKLSAKAEVCRELAAILAPPPGDE